MKNNNKTPEKKNKINNNVIQFNNPNLNKNKKGNLVINNNKHIQKLEELVKDIKVHIPDVQVYYSKVDSDFQKNNLNDINKNKNNNLKKSNNSQNSLHYKDYSNNSFYQDKKVSNNYYYNLMMNEDYKFPEKKNVSKEKELKYRFIDLKNI